MTIKYNYKITVEQLPAFIIFNKNVYNSLETSNTF